MLAIETRNLGKSFAGRRACWDVTFEVARGEVFGLLGPNGAGKTTTLRMLAGLLAPDAGDGQVAGERIRAGKAGSGRLRGRVGLLTEAPGFYDRLTAAENLRYFGRLYGLAAHEADRRAARLLSRFALSEHGRRPFAELSRGMKQKLAIARALLHEPEVVFLDEPTVGLDPEATLEVRATVAQLASERTAIVLCTHHLDEVERLCGRAAFIAGRLVGIHAVGAGGGARRVRIALAGPISAALIGAARALPAVQSAAVEGASLLLAISAGGADGGVPAVVAALVSAGARIESVVPQRAALEEAYVALLARARAEGLAA